MVPSNFDNVLQFTLFSYLYLMPFYVGVLLNIHLFIHSFIFHSFINFCFIISFTYMYATKQLIVFHAGVSLIIHSFIHSFIQLLIYLFIHSFVSFCHFLHSFIPLIMHSFDTNMVSPFLSVFPLKHSNLDMPSNYSGNNIFNTAGIMSLITASANTKHLSYFRCLSVLVVTWS